MGEEQRPVIDMIKLERQYITTDGNKSRLNFDFSTDGNPSKMWFEVENQYSQYLCTERCDAFIIGIMPYLLKNGQDLSSEIPVTRELYFNLTEYLIPALVKYDKHYSMIKLDIPVTDEAVPCAGGTGTGVSGGVDSFFSILQNRNPSYENLKITHLCIFNVGSFCGKRGFKSDIMQKVIERGKSISEELGLPLIITNSNLSEVFPRNHRCTHTFSSVFAVCCLSKLFKTYLYASSHDISKFSLINSSKNDCSKIDLITIPAFSTERIKIVSQGILKTRFEKTKFIADFPVVQKHLHVCTDEAENCNKCSKCMRTILALDALNKSDEFKDVFDMEYYRKHKFRYFVYLFEKHIDGDDYIEEAYQIIKRRLSLLSFCFIYAYVLVKNFIFNISYPDYNRYICIRVMGINFKFRKR